MFLGLIVAATLCLLSSRVWGATEKASAPNAAGTDTCACNYTLVPFYLAFHPTRRDHFYTTSFDELVGAERSGWTRSPDAGRVLNQSAPGAIPLYRLWNNAISDHFYTISMVERDRTAFTTGWLDEGIAAYVLPGPACGTLPFYRTYGDGWKDHYYTNSPGDMVYAVKTVGFTFESVAGYIWPAEG